ncbi:sigma-70 family RNA polymerase sigma factor [Chondromyces apiculatus]|uniref:RNA polymerase sigma-70 region 2 domain-containing protein n=1 Tax=Chondromyces apiculatus DSM 436 TaxID=1192034 RepID=A0A017TB18_9BACT|nr:RNA polymerase sigma factor [Chondromyces apiculatus]EYF06015.1 Hypothetical protein CAP_2475 [Chondromyces apiculatus DSM 436]
MTPRRRRDGAAHAPASFFMDEMPIVRMAPYVRALLRAMRVPPQDVEDLVQEVTAAAWVAMTEGRFRPLPGQPLGDALKLWLTGITWRQVSHYREKAYRRREVPDAAPWAVSGADPWLPHLPALQATVEARDILRAFDLMPPHSVEVLMLRYAAQCELKEIAETLGVSLYIATMRLRSARREFNLVLRRWRYS